MKPPLTEQQHEICDAVAKLRADMGLSVADFARRVGVSDRMVQYWERHTHAPTGRRLARLRRLYEYHEEHKRWARKHGTFAEARRSTRLS